MKKINAFAAVSTAMLTMAFGMTSCNDNNDLKQLEHVEVTAEELVDSVFVNDFTYAYDQTGTDSDKDFVPDINIGIEQNTPLTRGANGAGNMALSILKWAGQNVAGGITGKVGCMIFDSIVKVPSDTEEKLEKLCANMEELKNMVTELSEKGTNIEAAGIYNTRMKEYNNLYLWNTTHYLNIIDYARKGDEEKMKNELNDWAKGSINGTMGCNATITYMDAIVDMANSQQLVMPELYDYWVYQTTPWEHMGYQKREQLRAADISVAAIGYLMTVAYYQELGGAGSERLIEIAEKKYDKFCKFYSKYAEVEHHDNQLICQIKGAHIVFNKNLVERDMLNHPWFSSGTCWNSISLSAFMYGENGMRSAEVLSRSLTPSEVETIKNYYKDKNLTFEQIMKNVGFNTENLQEGKRHIMTLNSGASRENEHWYNRNYFLKFDKVAAVNENKLMLDNFSVGCMWIEKIGSKNLSHVHYVMRWWDHYQTDDCEYFRVDIDHRYNGMKPF